MAWPATRAPPLRHLVLRALLPGRLTSDHVSDLQRCCAGKLAHECLSATWPVAAAPASSAAKVRCGRGSGFLQMRRLKEEIFPPGRSMIWTPKVGIQETGRPMQEKGSPAGPGPGGAAGGAPGEDRGSWCRSEGPGTGSPRSAADRTGQRRRASVRATSAGPAARGRPRRRAAARRRGSGRGYPGRSRRRGRAAGRDGLGALGVGDEIGCGALPPRCASAHAVVAEEAGARERRRLEGDVLQATASNTEPPRLFGRCVSGSSAGSAPSSSRGSPSPRRHRRRSRHRSRRRTVVGGSGRVERHGPPPVLGRSAPAAAGSDGVTSGR